MIATRVGGLFAALALTAALAAAARADLADQPSPGAYCGQPGAGGSFAIGAVVGTTPINGIDQPRTVVDMNALSAYAAKTTYGTGARYTGLEPVGWVYRDDVHNFWFQKAPNAQLDRPFAGTTLRDILGRSLGVNPAGSDAVAMGIAPGVLDEHLQAAPCFARGDQFYPHETAPGATP